MHISLVFVPHPFPSWKAWPHNPDAALMISKYRPLVFSYKSLLNWDYYQGMISPVKALAQMFLLSEGVEAGLKAWLSVGSWESCPGKGRHWRECRVIFCTLVPLGTNVDSKYFKIINHQFFLTFCLSTTVIWIILFALLMIYMNQSEKEIKPLKS